MKKKVISSILAASMLLGLAACNGSSNAPKVVLSEEDFEVNEYEDNLIGEDAETLPEVNPDYIGKTAEEICDMLTIEEKAAQMVQGAIYSLNQRAMHNEDYGSVLSTFSDWPAKSDVQWRTMINNYQKAALESDTGIPFIFGQDSVHGVNTANGCVIFPHNINVGATNDKDLAYEMGVAVGSDIIHTGMIWNFAPCVASAQDPRWGRTYESYSSNLQITTDLSVAFTEGLMSEGVVACAKHFFADGDALYGTGEESDVVRIIDRGDARLSGEEIEERLQVYQDLIDSGVQTIMLSHSSLNGVKMHENAEFISILKDDMGFEGVVISDWNSLHNCSGADYRENVILCINAGCDMLMEPDDFAEARDIIVDAYNNGEISEERINDAVTRIIQMKIDAGLFDDPYLDELEANATYEFNSDYSHELAREIAAKSCVPLVDGGHLTIEPGMRVFVTGPAATDTAAMCGGWTYIWDSEADAESGFEWVPSCVTILDGLEAAADEIGFTVVTNEDEIDTCDMVVLCVGEVPYSEWQGDTEDLSITGMFGLPGNYEAIELAARSGLPTLTLIVAGRNVIIDQYLSQWNSVVMCYLPGTEGGNGIADVVTGKVPYEGTLPMPYYSSVSQIGSGDCWHDVGYSAVN